MSVHSVAKIHFAWIEGPIVIQRRASNRLKHRPSMGILTYVAFATALESSSASYYARSMESRAGWCPLEAAGTQVTSTTLVTTYKYPLP